MSLGPVGFVDAVGLLDHEIAKAHKGSERKAGLETCRLADFALRAFLCLRDFVIQTTPYARRRRTASAPANGAKSASRVPANGTSLPAAAVDSKLLSFTAVGAM